eukprot:gene1288-1627_t
MDELNNNNDDKINIDYKTLLELMGSNYSNSDIEQCECKFTDESVYQHFLKYYGKEHLDLVGLTCGESVLRGSNIFCPGIRGTPKYLKKGSKVSVFVDIEGKQTNGFVIEKYFKEKTIFIGNGVTQLDRNQFFTDPKGVGIVMTERIWSCPPLNSVLEDKLFLQHLPSLITVYQLDLKQYSKILDMCAAPGGKTTLIATIIKDQGEIIALDKNKSKAKKIQQLCERLSIKSVKCMAKDSSLIHKQDYHRTDQDRELFALESFDSILLDGPCSGIGTRPRFQDSIMMIDLENSASFQKRLLVAAIDLLKVGGTLVYSTCTINPQENEENVAFVLNNYSHCMKLQVQHPHIGNIGLENCGLSDEDRSKVQRFDPSDSIGSIGFFIAKFIKLKSSITN